MQKRCPSCQQTLSADAFRKVRTNRDGLSGYCRDCLNAKQREKYKADPQWAEKRKAYARSYYTHNPERLKDLRRTNRQRYRSMVLAHYGEQCVCCSESNVAFLTVDHINDDGADHRRSLGKNAGSLQVWRWIVQHGFPDHFQILCWNCNAAKHIYGSCPHSGSE